MKKPLIEFMDKRFTSTIGENLFLNNFYCFNVFFRKYFYQINAIAHS